MSRDTVPARDIGIVRVGSPPARPRRSVVRGATVLTMEPDRAPFVGDVLAEDGIITAVGDVGEVGDAASYDARGQLLFPGFVDGHRHLWQSVLRGVAADWTLGEYFQRMRGEIGGVYRPEDVYVNTLLGALEALDAGVTCLVDCSHNINSPQDADAGWAALVDSGIRGVFAYGASNDQAVTRDDSPHTEDIRRLQTEADPADGRVSLGMMARGPEFSGRKAVEADWALARELGIPITVHVGGGLNGAKGSILALAERGLLSDDTTYVHCNMLVDEELDLIAATGGRASVSPEAEANMGHGPAATARLRQRGIPTSISVDVCTNVGGDMFGAMRATLALQRGTEHSQLLVGGRPIEPPSLSVADALTMATSEGASAVGLGHAVGSIEVGKQADLVSVRLDDVNMFPASDPVATLVTAAHPGNIDLVMVAGALVKSHGRLTGDAFDQVKDRVRACRDRLVRSRQ